MSIGGYGGEAGDNGRDSGKGTAGNGAAGNGAVGSDGIGVALLPLQPRCRPTEWYLQRVRKRRRVVDHSHLPDNRPMTRAQLLADGITPARIRKFFTTVEWGMHVHVDSLLTERTDSGHVRSRRIAAATLVRAHLATRPGRIATGFAAGPFYGMRYFVDEEILEFLVPNGAEIRGAPPHLRLTRSRQLDAYRNGARSLDPWFRTHLCTDPAVTLARMLLTLIEEDTGRDRHWRIPDLTTLRPHLSPAFIRCVQVSDHFHQAANAEKPGNVEPLVAAGLPAEVAAAVLGATDVGAESPPETLLRLVVEDLAPGLRSQIPVFRENGRLLSSADLGWEERRVYLFYDGAHHLDRVQRDHDSEVLAILQQDGGRVFRVTAGNLQNADRVRELRGRIAAALER